MYGIYSFAAGVYVVAYWPVLPGYAVAAVLAVTGLVVLPTRARVMGGLLLGISYGVCWGHYSLSHHLPDHLNPSDHSVTGEIVGIPVDNGHRVRFNLKLLPSPAHLPLKQLRLSWYQHEEKLVPGQIWQLQVRLRRPRGNVNPGGFDYQGWLLGQGISATGYVRPGGDHRLLATTLSVDSLRYRLRESIKSSPASSTSQALMAALTIGDRSLIDSELWQRLSQLGLVHLLVVSGLHIGFMATIGFVSGAILARVIGLIGWSINARYCGALLALFTAMAYSLMAGLSLPTQRAMIMVAVALLAILANRHVGKVTGFGLALAGVALVDPLATLNAGFWMSFGAVAGLIWLVPVFCRVSKWRQLLGVQWLVFVLLFLPLVLWQLPVAWFAPLLNLLAIPWVGFLIIPLCLLGSAIAPFSNMFADNCWWLAGWQLDQFLRLLHWFELPEWLPQFLPFSHSGVSLWLMVAVVTLLILPRGIPGRFLFVPLFLVLAWSPTKRQHPLTVTALDVGQGLSVVVQTARHNLVYDTGPAYGDFDTGSAVVAPFLRKQGVTLLDKLVVSHADSDHAGGAAALRTLFPPDDFLVGEKLGIPNVSERLCLAGESWQWDGVTFQFVYPFPDTLAEGNNRSCVLLIRHGDDEILLTGDIEASVERQLLSLKHNFPDAISVLVAPHHGSRTSSSAAFVSALTPLHVVFSAGFRHHFGHPAEDVVGRYKQHKAVLWNTAEQGAIQFRWDQQGKLSVSTMRNEQRRYWYSQRDN
ncbi:DNA internalization-related competence protein ComEC/Rec2 [Porticoccus sp.]